MALFEFTSSFTHDGRLGTFVVSAAQAGTYNVKCTQGAPGTVTLSQVAIAPSAGPAPTPSAAMLYQPNVDGGRLTTVATFTTTSGSQSVSLAAGTYAITLARPHNTPGQTVYGSDAVHLTVG